MNQGDGLFSVRPSSFSLDHLISQYRLSRKDDVLILKDFELLVNAKRTAQTYSSFAEMDIDSDAEVDWFSPLGYRSFLCSQEEIVRMMPLFEAYCDVDIAEKYAAGETEGFSNPPMSLPEAKQRLDQARLDLSENATVYRAYTLSFDEYLTRTGNA